MDEVKKAERSTRKTWATHVKKNHIFYPDERLVGMLKNKVATTNKEKLTGLDVGFGSGRHLQLMIDLGIHTYGVEYTDEAIAATNEVLGNQALLKKMWLEDYRIYDFKIKFDVIIAWGVVFLTVYSQLQENIKKLSQHLSPDGSLYLNFRTKENWFFKLGEKLDKNTFLLDERAGTYAGSCYTFLSIEEIKHLINQAGLKINKVERVDLWKNNLTERNSWYVCEASKA